MLGTLDRSPPPFFRQGPSALTKLVFFSAFALFLMVADGRFQVVRPIRAALAVALLPVQQTLAVPVHAWQGARDYIAGLDRALAAGRAADARLAAMSERAARVTRLESENAQLRQLIELRPALPEHTQAAEVLYEAADPFSRKLFVDRGQGHGVLPGSPVLVEGGVLGQVTRVYPLTAEVTLLVDREAAIPVRNTRTQVRSVAFGGLQLGGRAAMELRFVDAGADVKPGDTLVTSGLDGVYPGEIAVATVVSVERPADATFARVELQPAARPERVRHVLLVDPIGHAMPDRPPATPPVTARGARQPAAASAPASGGPSAAGRAGAATAPASAAAPTPAPAPAPATAPTTTPSATPPAVPPAAPTTAPRTMPSATAPAPAPASAAAAPARAPVRPPARPTGGPDPARGDAR